MTLEENIITSTVAATGNNFSRKVWHVEFGVAPAHLAIFMDGEFYVDGIGAPSIIDEQVAQGKLPPMACLFVSHVSSQNRHEDYTCSALYADYIVKDLIPWLMQRSRVQAAGGHTIAGASLSGLQAAYIALQHAGIFDRTLSQSGSFWWQDEWLRKWLAGQQGVVGGRYWLSVGDKETSSGVAHPPTGLRQDVDQISAVQRFAEALKGKGAETNYHGYSGGHEFTPWKEELASALQWLYR